MNYLFLVTTALIPVMSLLASVPLQQDTSSYIKDEEPKTESSSAQAFFLAPRFELFNEIDKLLNIIYGGSRQFALTSPPKTTDYAPHLPELQELNNNNGFFSEHPLVATVSSSSQDMQLSCGALKEIYDSKKADLVQIAGSEVLTKITAYRDLKKGQFLSIPALEGGKITVQRFLVDEVIDLWLGMPAFGLKPTKAGYPAILLFRGTNFRAYTLSGVASLISDLDPSGPGYNVYKRAEPQLQAWLQKMQNAGYSNRVLGYSLGAALAVYTYVNQYSLLSQQGSIVYNPPGFQKEVVEKWNALPSAWKKGLTVYVTEGDVISKVGNLVGQVYAFSTGQQLTPLQAHTLFVSGHKEFTKSLVDVDKENAER